MTIKELIETLSQYDLDLPVVREYDSSFEPIQVTSGELSWDGSRYGDTLYENDVAIKAVIIHSGDYYGELRVYKPSDRVSPLTTALIQHELERVIPKIKEAFEQDDFFYKLRNK